jgi:hypothetical protein
MILGRWLRANKTDPCPVCRRTSWCARTADGTVAACRRVEVGAWRSKIDRAGCPVYLHRLADGRLQAASLPRIPSRHPQRAAPDVLHAVYGDLLASLNLSRHHRDALRSRGLNDVEIDRRFYRTLPSLGRSRVVHTLHDRFGDRVLGVPGVVAREGDGRRYLTIAGPAGLLVPCRDLTGQVVAIKVRRDDPVGDRPKYVYLSSRRDGGPGPGAPVHVPLGISPGCHTVRVTEGEPKADATFALSGLPTISVPGVSTWRPALPVLRRLGACVVRLAFDADANHNPHVASALAACARAVTAAGFRLELEVWDIGDGKGIDDLLTTGSVPSVLTGRAAMAALQCRQAARLRFEFVVEGRARP